MQNDRLLERLIRDYWFNKLLSTRQSVNKGKVRQTESIKKKLASGLLTDLSAITNNIGVGEFIVLLACYGVLLQKYFALVNGMVCSPDMDTGGGSTKDHILFYSFWLNGDETFKEVVTNLKAEVERVINHR